MLPKSFPNIINLPSQTSSGDSLFYLSKQTPLGADVGGQHCPCPVRVSFLSGFSGKSCLVSGFCPDFLSGVYLSGFCLSRFCQLSGYCLYGLLLRLEIVLDGIVVEIQLAST